MTPRIVVTVSGGVASLEGWQNWPEGLELYIVDYDAGEDLEDEELADLDGGCTISCYIGGSDEGGELAERVATEFDRIEGL